MTEEEWQECEDVLRMLETLSQMAAENRLGYCSCLRFECRRDSAICNSYRKLRLVTLECCRRIEPLLPHADCRAAIKALDQFLEDEIEKDEYEVIVFAFDKTRRMRFPMSQATVDGPWNALYCSVHRKWRRNYDDDFAEARWRLVHSVSLEAIEYRGHAESVAFCQNIRDIFGNPFRPVVADPVWLTPTVQSIATAIYQDRAFDRLPILADALEEAGCTNADLLLHCRQPGEHVRGCWVVDLVLGKE